jgi:DNA-binding transcriptional MerR regulator
MEKIGDFAKRCQTTIKTLRYYDQLGLLIPDYIDTFTNWRYYGAGKVAEMRRITELKEIGFLLEEIKRYCDANDDEREHMIEEKHRALTKLAKDTAEQLEKLAEIKLNLRKGEKIMSVNFNTPFENDERVIGRWEFVGTVRKREDFAPDDAHYNETIYEELYFLPEGEQYWGFAWTKGFIKSLFQGGFLAVPYTLDKVDGQTFMFVDYPDYGGVWVLKQTDALRHSVYSVARNDKVDLPFTDDPQVHGKWFTIDLVNTIDAFDPVRRNARSGDLSMKKLKFSADGIFSWTWQNTHQHRWTKGKALTTWWRNDKITHTTAPAYEIRVINGTEYLFFEHKSGDYTWGKMNPSYYVLSREMPAPDTDNPFDKPFENDETMPGRWEMVSGTNLAEIYFLPQGQYYWAFKWTKGYLECGGVLCPYKIEETDDGRFIKVAFNEDEWVLRQTDNKSYTLDEISRWDNIDLPFADDPEIYGLWHTVDYVQETELFDPENLKNKPEALYLQSLRCFPDGRVHKKYRDHSNHGNARWTKGIFLEHFNGGTVAPAYTLRRIGDADYMFYEWKSGDYTWGKFKPWYYVLKRDGLQ